ncbi:NAD(P)H-hydrate dehydratase [Terrihabitans sp. B22-R8]|uniref:NAD(P)H-hydrate dehydratase n=1 Tax=Terrihabitans sp. B22-R8 TaxID=3425128 RepID=UPI00403D0600
MELLTNEEMAQADALAIAGGVDGFDLMLAAGQAVAEAAETMCSLPGPVIVLCGPGNNGGDGFVAARLLAERGYDVRLCFMGERASVRGAAAKAAALWRGPVEPFAEADLFGTALVIDALFGAGLARDIDGDAAVIIQAVNASAAKVLAVDVPSGVDGTTGSVRGTAVRADRTVTFFRYKPGHLLMPGRAHCGERVLAQIGISSEVLKTIEPVLFRNDPPLWRGDFPVPGADSHKYTRGHSLIAAGSEMTGAARLAARAALRTGAGLVTLGAPPGVMPIYQAALEAVIVRPMEGMDGYRSLLEDVRRNALLIGPGIGGGEVTRCIVLAALESGRHVVLDADALTEFEKDSQLLFDAIRKNGAKVVLTPHDGEFRRLFKALRPISESRLERARLAAEASGAIVILKGSDTIIAGPEGRAAIADNAPPWLATAGSGDVLAGIVTGLLAQRMPAFEAACAAVWMHGEAANIAGPGLISEDLPDALRGVLQRLYGNA